MRCNGGCAARRGLGTVLLAASLVVGCGKGAATGDVSGTITLLGRAPNLDGLQITFLSDAGGTPPVNAAVKLDGTYTALGVPAGKVLVGFTYRSTLAKSKSEAIRERAKRMNSLKGTDAQDFWQREKKLAQEAREKAEAKSDASDDNPIPVKYRDPRTSGIHLFVEAGKENTLTRDIQP